MNKRSNRVKITFISVLLIIITAVGTFWVNEQKRINSEKEVALNVIQGYFDTYYSSFHEVVYKDLTPYLDIQSRQSLHKMATLNFGVQMRELSLKCGSLPMGFKDLQGKILIHKTRIVDSKMLVTVEIVPDEQKEIDFLKLRNEVNYAIFGSLGKHEFTLVLIDGAWKISKHDYEFRSEAEREFSSFEESFISEEVKQRYIDGLGVCEPWIPNK
jgi:hypothetical protein